MLKYVDTKVVFQEIPDNVTLAINISNCPNHCKNCHSPYLSEDIGEKLTIDVIENLIKQNSGIDCICFMGGDNDIKAIASFAEYFSIAYPLLKIAWYSGKEMKDIHIDLWYFDYIKVGPYIEELGPLDNPNTNQRLYEIKHLKSGDINLVDITNKFQKQ